MKVIKVSFEVCIGQGASGMTEEDLRRDMERATLIYGRSNAVFVDNLKIEKIGGDT
jgi:hypothetical protein